MYSNCLHGKYITTCHETWSPEGGIETFEILKVNLFESWIELYRNDFFFR